MRNLVSFLTLNGWTDSAYQIPHRSFYDAARTTENFLFRWQRWWCCCYDFCSNIRQPSKTRSTINKEITCIPLLCAKFHQERKISRLKIKENQRGPTSIGIQNKHSIDQGFTHWSIFFQAFPTMKLQMFDLSFGTNDAANAQVATWYFQSSKLSPICGNKIQ